MPLNKETKPNQTIQIGGHTEKSDQNNRMSKRLQLLGEIRKKLGLTTLLKSRRGDIIKTLRIMEFLIRVDVFLVFLLEREIYCQERFQIKIS